MDECAYPIFANSGMALAADILGEKHVAGMKRSGCAVADANIHGTGQRYAPLAARRIVATVQILAIEIILKH
jgi:hypothetical protein